MSFHPKRRALVLLSGGVDSQLALCLLRELGVEVQALVFTSPFFAGTAARAAARSLGVPIEVVDFTSSLVRILESNSTIDDVASDPSLACHAAMVRLAGDRLDEAGCDFMATGEVLGQRASTQSAESLQAVAEQSGYGERLVRPLSARLLPMTLPERAGWVDRARLLELEGGGRGPQQRLARQYGLCAPSEKLQGSRLSDPVLRTRLQDLRAHEGLQGKRALGLLCIGRHFRLGPATKLVLGRNESENADLEGNAELYELVLKLEDVHGPTGVLPVIATEDQVLLAASICARYSDAETGAPTRVRVRSSRGVQILTVRAQTPAELDLHRI
jgi:predicted subunit of tRNA(5-methylaminomethyl-2-thiouridylate) methyltransferase